MEDLGENIEKIETLKFSNKPATINEIGDNVFIRIPFYKSTKDLNIVYINPVIYKKVFEKEYNYEQAKKDIIEKFSVTLEENDQMLGYGYVDKQIDPTDIALNGNKGSGRAFYLYENCNIKGCKTPLATSQRDDYNNGKYSLDCAIQECLISNVLNNINGFNNFQTLAIIDLKEEYFFPHTEKPLPCGLIVRYYENNELYRFSHRFVNNKPFSQEELYLIAEKIGDLEGNKFIKRFIHGAWSIGNLSIEANMIDLDTSYFVKGRHPQWSFTDKYITNFFAFEHYGQFKLLETILNSNLNIDNVSLEELKLIVENNRTKIIRKEFAFLIGYNEDIYNKYQEYINNLADEFTFLSQTIYDNYDNLNCLDENCLNTYIFDFSNFFRFYEITKQKGNWNIQKGLNLLLNKNAKYIKYLYDDEDYHVKINQFFSNIIAYDTNKYMNFINRALKFIENFDKTNELIDSNENINKNKKLIQTYLENEDKKYLMARKWMRAELIDFYNNKGEQLANDVINIIINFYSRKDYSSKCLNCDLVIFEEGILFREINTDGYNRFCLNTFENITTESFILNIDGIEYTLMKTENNSYSSEFIFNTLISKLDNYSIYSSKNNKVCFKEIGRDINNICNI